MCGRFIISKKIDEITERFHVDVEKNIYKIIYNATPTQFLPVITNTEPTKLNFFKWGLIPFWANDISIAVKLINARAESVAEKPSFRNSFKSKRCLVVADGFYEWKKIKQEKQPYRIYMKNESLFAFAGLWDSWKNKNNEVINSFTIITTEPNSLVGKIHNRMPVILNKEDEHKWLNENLSVADAKNLLKAFSAEKMMAHPVSKLVNLPSNNSPELIQTTEKTGLF
ncbi:MAG: SOS response-associated peptidase [Bacteroidota bacterium]|nr:SOS response-associated peptidase [Bacteroidota bacterium]